MLSFSIGLIHTFCFACLAKGRFHADSLHPTTPLHATLQYVCMQGEKGASMLTASIKVFHSSSGAMVQHVDVSQLGRLVGVGEGEGGKQSVPQLQQGYHAASGCDSVGSVGGGGGGREQERVILSSSRAMVQHVDLSRLGRLVC